MHFSIYKVGLLKFKANKKLLMLFIASCLFSQSILAQSADDMKKAALQACSAQVASVPEAQQKMIKNSCECAVKNTDYKKIFEYAEAGKLDKVQEESLKVAQLCAQQAFAN